MQTKSARRTVGVDVDVKFPKDCIKIEAETPARRSTRKREINENDDAANDENNDKKKSKHKSSSVRTSPSSLPISSIASLSVKQLELDLSSLYRRYLGQSIPIVNGGQVKGGVVHSCCTCSPTLTDKNHNINDDQMNDHSILPLSSIHHYIDIDRQSLVDRSPRITHTVSLPRFNRMSGIMEWSNAICLFVNISSDPDIISTSSCPYPNEFYEDEKDGNTLLTWFASPRHQLETPIIQRLLTLNSSTPDCFVLLFARVIGCPYRFYGCLSYVDHDPDHQPIKFIWKCQMIRKIKDTNKG